MESKRFQFLKMNPQPCTGEEVEQHLRAFAHSFLDKNYADRWVHITLERPEKAKAEMRKFERHFNPQFCRILGGAESLPTSLGEMYADQQGIYFNGIEQPCKITAPEAAGLSTERTVDALFSIQPGKLALFFFHEGWVWKCAC